MLNYKLFDYKMSMSVILVVAGMLLVNTIPAIEYDIEIQSLVIIDLKPDSSYLMSDNDEYLVLDLRDRLDVYDSVYDDTVLVNQYRSASDYFLSNYKLSLEVDGKNVAALNGIGNTYYLASSNFNQYDSIQVKIDYYNKSICNDAFDCLLIEPKHNSVVTETWYLPVVSAQEMNSTDSQIIYLDFPQNRINDIVDMVIAGTIIAGIIFAISRMPRLIERRKEKNAKT